MAKVVIEGEREEVRKLLRRVLPEMDLNDLSGTDDSIAGDLPQKITPEAIQELARELRASPSVRRAIFCTDAGEFDVFGKMPPKPLPMAATMMLKTMPDDVYARLNPEPASLTR